MEYLELELKISPRGEGVYAVSVLDSPAGETNATLELTLSDPIFRDRLRLVEAARGAGRAGRSFAPTRPEEAPLDRMRSAQELGRDLFAALTREKALYACYHTSLVQARGQGKGLRLRLRIEAPDLAALPWEYLFDPDFKQDYLSLSRETPIVRHLELGLPIEPLTLEPPIRILGMVGARHGLNVAREQEQMALAIEHLTDKGVVRLQWVGGHTWRDLSEALEQGPWHIFHFIGHGGFDEATGEGLVLLDAEAGGGGEPHRLPARDLGTLLADHASLKLAVLNACEGARSSETSLCSSAGAILASRGLPAVVSMQYEISDRAAIEFARTFYDSLADGDAVDTAVSEARQAIKMALGDNVEWGTPVLHLRARDGTLFRVDVAGALFRAAPASAPPPAAPARPSPAPAVAAPDARKGLLILLRKVRQFWIEGVLERSLQRSARLDLGMEIVGGATASPFGAVSDTADAGAAAVPAGRRVAEVFEELGGSLLVLGEPGSGKTISLLELARDLLDRAEKDPACPVPVLFDLASWKGPGQDFGDWLVDRLAVRYLIPKRVGRAWLDEGRLLPLLDGLDEVAPEARSACVEAVNAFTEAGLQPSIAVCCRLKEYLELPVRLALNGAIRLQPFTRDQVFAFLERAGPPLAALKSLLERDSGMLIEARSPLMLSLMVQAYQDLPVTTLESAGAETLAARRQKLMEAFVARMFRRAEAGAHA
ncbi:MAG TPA: CHAT domain-containing protein [Thermoanaerobaculia bacterium]|nr:CHAT domain-containing protein [Thermoanaerobaculia bacterium]